MLIGDFYYELPKLLPTLNATSFYYVAFCFLVFCLSRSFKSIFRPFVLLVANLIFIYSFGPNNLLWLCGLSLLSYVLGLLLEKHKSNDFLFGSILLYVSFLFYFKYRNTFEGNIIIPLGLSFYSFKIISYFVDVFRGKVKAELNLIYYLDFVMFFPCVTAGPINRSKEFFDELRQKCDLEYSDISTGFFMLAAGLFEKMVVCDFIKTVVTRSLGNAELTGLNVLLGITMYSFEIYLDFDAYSNMAIGVARMLGFRFPKNFNVPYLSSSIKDFWNRWHISLSSWLRDYVYFPLGGSRKGKLRRHFNILVVFLVSSLWHGLTVNFLIWGMGHALIRIVEELAIDRLGVKDKKLNCFGRISAIVFNFCLVTLLWVFFRYTDFNEACFVIKRVFAKGSFDYELIGLTINEVKWLLILIIGVVIADVTRYFLDIYELIGEGPIVIRWLLYVSMIVIFMVFGVYGGGSFDASDFIYRWF